MTCEYCGAKLDPSQAGADGRVICPECKAAVAVQPAQTPKAGAPDVNAIKQWIDRASPEELDRLSAAIAQTQNQTPADDFEPIYDARRRAFPLVWMLLAMPFAVLLLGTAIGLSMTQQWSGVIVGVLCGGGLFAVSLLAMRGRWTAGRALWILVVSAILIGFSINVGIKQRTIIPFKGLEVEAATLAQTPNTGNAAQAAAQLLRPKLFPLVIHSRRDRQLDPALPSLPMKVDDYDAYDLLPASLKPEKPEEVHTLVLLDWGWTRRGESAGYSPAIFVGHCEIKVINRETHNVIATTTLQDDKNLPARGAQSANWYGPQPTYADVIAYLKQLPVTAEAP